MKRLLLPIFSSALLTSSASLIASTNINTGIKITEQKQTFKKFTNTDYKVFNKQVELKEKEMNEIQTAAENWNDEEINQVLNEALEYHNNQLTINQNKLDTTKLPQELLNHLDLALNHLNNVVVSLGYIKPYILNNNLIHLTYSNNIDSLNNSNDGIINFESQKKITNNINFEPFSVWFSAYGPSKWWKFWEWGGYINFDEGAVKLAKVVKLIAELASIAFLIKNIKNIENVVLELKTAWNANNTIKTNELLKNLSKLLGDVELSILGTIGEILTVITAAITFGLALLSMGGWLLPLIELIISLVPIAVNEMVRADTRGVGVKWKFIWFIKPDGFSSR